MEEKFLQNVFSSSLMSVFETAAGPTGRLSI